MDYSILIKRNFIIMMNKCYDDTKRDENMKHWASAYTDVLLQLPLYPILSKEDVSHLQIHDKIREELYFMIENNRDLYEVSEFLKHQ